MSSQSVAEFEKLLVWDRNDYEPAKILLIRP